MKTAFSPMRRQPSGETMPSARELSRRTGTSSLASFCKAATALKTVPHGLDDRIGGICSQRGFCCLVPAAPTVPAAAK